MKTKLFLMTIAITIGFITTTFAQNPDFTDLDVSNIALMKPGNNSQGILLGDDINKAVTILGSPTNIKDQYFEMNNATAKVYTYGGSKLYFINGKLDSFNILDGSVMVGTLNGDTYKIGDKIVTKTITRTVPRGQHGTVTETITTKTFFNFKLLNNPGRINGLQYQTISHSYVQKNNAETDLGFGLLFDSHDTLVGITIAEQ